MKKYLWAILLLASSGWAIDVRDSVVASADDGSVVSITFYIHFASVLFGTSGDDARNTGLDFADLPVPDGATITSAVLRFHSQGDASGGDCNVIIYGEDTASASAYAQAVASTMYDARITTTAHVHWNCEAWTDNGDFNSPDISTIVQEWVDRSDHLNDSTQTFGILIKNNASGEDHLRTADSYDEGVLTSTKILISYTIGGGETTKGAKVRKP
jgi:type IV pilus assembly protein PilY1